MEIPRWWWCWWVLLVICGIATEISLHLWEGCPGKPTLVISIVQSIQEIRINFCPVAFPCFGFFCVYFDTCTSRAVSFHWWLLFVNAGILAMYSGQVELSLDLLCFPSSHQQFPLLFFWLYSSNKTWPVWDEGFCHLLSPEKSSRLHRSVILLRTQIRNSSSVYWRLCGDGNKWMKGHNQ